LLGSQARNGNSVADVEITTAERAFPELFGSDQSRSGDQLFVPRGMVFRGFLSMSDQKKDHPTELPLRFIF
jgi:hypothetical protein